MNDQPSNPKPGVPKGEAEAPPKGGTEAYTDFVQELLEKENEALETEHKTKNREGESHA